MTFSNTNILSVVELAIYLVLFPITLYIGWRHGRHGLLGYFYLNLACGVRIVADIVSLAQHSSTGPPSMASIILGSIGLSPLILALAGFLHEAHRSLLTTVCTSHADEKAANRWLWFAQFQIHGMAATGMILLVLGGVQLSSAKTTEDENKDNKLRSAGALLLLFLVIGLVQYAGWLLYRCGKVQARLNRGVVDLTKWSLVAVVFILVKILYSVVYTFDQKDSSINPITGTLAIKVVFVFGVQLFAVIAMVVAGWKSMDITHATSFKPVVNDADSGKYEGCRLTVQEV